MTDKFTDDEIIELLNAYVERMCGKCNVKDLGACCGTCFITPISQATDLINRQKAQIESLNAVHADMTESLRLAAEANKDIQAEIEAWKEEVNRLSFWNHIKRTAVINEFAERVKSDLGRIPQYHFTRSQVEWSIDTLKKEMTEENK